MNPAAALDAIAGAAQGPSATVQALQALLAALAEPVAAVADAQQAAHNDATLPDADVVSLPGDTQTLAATAQQGRATLGQLATEPAALHTSNDAAPDPAARPALLPAGDTQQIAAETLAVPVLLAALHSPQTAATQRQQAPAPQRARHEDGDDEAPPQAQTPEAEPEPQAEPDADAQALRQRLQRHGQADALAELARGRQLLVVQPQGGGVAQALLLSGRGLRCFAARWWPGAADATAWRQWRVFRDGDPLFTRGLRSRSAGTGCLLLLGTRAGRGSDSGVVLEVADRIRFAQALGGQWSLVLLAAPAEGP